MDEATMAMDGSSPSSKDRRDFGKGKMTNSSKMLIGLVVDRSGSMGQCQSDMEGGIASLLSKQAEENPSAYVTLAQFDTHYEVVYPVTKITEVPHYHLVPRGMTALYDAVGRFVTDVGQDLAKMKEHKRPGKIMIVVVTDGLENSSREWTQSKVKELIDQQSNIYSWDFVFLGANMDAKAEAMSMGIRSHKAMTFNVANSGLVMDSLNTYASNYAAADSPVAMASCGFTPEDEANAVKETTSP